MLSYSALCTLALATVASANYAATSLFDEVLADMRYYAWDNDFDPLPIESFTVKANQTLFTYDNPTISITNGLIIGLSSLYREGNCTYGTYSGEMKMGCYITFTPVHLVMDASIYNSAHESQHVFAVSSYFDHGSCALVEFTRSRLGRLSLDEFQFENFEITTRIIQDEPNSVVIKGTDLVKQINFNITKQFMKIIFHMYVYILNYVAKRYSMPLAG